MKGMKGAFYSLLRGYSMYSAHLQIINFSNQKRWPWSTPCANRFSRTKMWRWFGGIFREICRNCRLFKMRPNPFQVVKKPYLVFFNLERCIDPLVPINGCPTPQVCVEKCPDSIFIYDQSSCSTSNLETIKSKLICNRNVDVTAIQSCSEITQLVNNDYCAAWYLPSESCK